MKPKTFLPAILAVVLGLAAAFLVRNSMMRTKPIVVAAAPKTLQAVVATSDLLAGQEILGENLSVTTVQATNPPQDTVASPSQLIGRVLSAPIVKGQTIHLTNLAPMGAGATLPSLVPAGMRAITINVDEANSLAGMLLPGCRVDVIGTLAAGKDSISRTLVPNVLVQAVGQRLTSARPEDGKEPPPFHTITVIVTPREAQMIDLAAMSARIRLALRPLTHGPGDDVVADKTGLNDLTGDDRSSSLPASTQPSNENAPVAIAPVTKRDVILILGSQVSHVKLDMPEPLPTEVDTTNEQKPVIDGAEPIQE